MLRIFLSMKYKYTDETTLKAILNEHRKICKQDTQELIDATVKSCLHDINCSLKQLSSRIDSNAEDSESIRRILAGLEDKLNLYFGRP